MKGCLDEVVGGGGGGKGGIHEHLSQKKDAWPRGVLSRSRDISGQTRID